MEVQFLEFDEFIVMRDGQVVTTSATTGEQHETGLPVLED